MQIIQLEVDHDNFFCPVTGQRITGSQSYEASPAQLGMWVDLVIDEPEINSPELDAKWQHYVEQLAEDDFIVMAEFLQTIDPGEIKDTHSLRRANSAGTPQRLHALVSRPTTTVGRPIRTDSIRPRFLWVF